MAQAAAWYDALPTVAPPPGMMLPTQAPPPGPAAPAPGGSPLIATTATVPSGDDDQSSSTPAPRRSWHDAIPSVSPPPGMQLAAASPDDSGNSGSTLSGAWLNLNAGIDDVASTILGVPADLLGGAYNFLASAGNAAGAPRVPMVGNLPGGSADVMNTLEPQPIVPHGFWERAARGTGAGLASLPLGGAIGGMVAGAAPELGAAAGAALPGAAGTTAANVAGTVGRIAGGVADAPALPAIIPTTTGAITGQAAEDVTPDAYKPYANFAGNLIGGGLGAIGQSLAVGGGSALARAGGSVGVGPKLDICGQRVTATPADIAANRLADAAGSDVGQFVDMLANAREQLVPGSQPTTAQLAPVPGVVGLEQSLRTANGEPFAARAAQQNRARIGAIDQQASADASPLSVGQYFTQRLDALQSSGSAALAQGRDLIGNAASQLGGAATPDAYGATAASAINTAQTPAIGAATAAADQALQQRNAAIATMPGGRQDIPGGLTAPEQYGADARAQMMINRQQQAQQVARLKAAINPTGDAGITSAPILQQVRGVYKDLSPNAAQPGGEEAAILARLQAMPSVVPLNDIFALRERVGDAISTEINAAGRTTTAPARRLMGIKTAIDDGLANAVDQQSQFEAQQVAAGAMQPGDTIQARMQAAAPGAPTTGARQPLPGTGTGGTAPPLPTATPPGTGTSVFTPAGRQVAVNYELANLPDLVTSHTPDMNPNPAFPPAMQPRDRTRAASQAQIAQMAGNLQPERLGASASAGEGAPIIGPDNIVESGNGRVLALQQAYAANGPQADAYRQFLAQQGLDTSGIDQPVLVRRRVTPMSDQDRVAFTQEANANPAFAMSATERAMAEGPTIPQETLALQQPGDIGSGANVPFVRSYLKSVVSPAERGLYVTDDGALSLEGQQRIRNALLARAYNNPNLISALAETGDPNIAAFGGALMDSAGPMARLRAGIENGEVSRNVDISAPVSQAVAAVQQARRQRLPLAGFVQQVDAFNQMSPESEEILKAAYGDNLQGRVSRGRLGDLLSFYAQQAGKQSVDQGRLFGENLTMQQLLQDAKARYGTNEATAGTSIGPAGDGAGASATGGQGGQFAADATGPQTRGGGQGGTGTAGARAGQQAGPGASVLPVAAPALRPLNADELTAYRAYKTQAQQLADTFDSRRVGEVLAPGDYRTAAQVPADITRARGGFDTADAAVMARFWNKGPTNAQDARDFLAAGGSPTLLRDCAADDLRARAVQPDGSLDLAEFRKWRTEHRGALTAFPDAGNALSGVAAAQQTLEARQAQLAALQQAHPLAGVTSPSQIMGRYWKAGDQGADGIRQFMRDTNGSPEASRALDEYAAYRLREDGAVNPDGTVDAGKLGTFTRNYAQALSQRPELRARLASVQGAQQALDDATAAHIARVKAYENDVAKNFINDDPLTAVRKAFTSGNPTKTFAKLAQAVRGSTDAQAGLKRAVVDYILQRMKMMKPADADFDFMSAAGLRKFIDSNKRPLRTLFGGQGLQNLEMVAADLRRQTYTAEAVAGSQTASRLAAAARHGTAAEGGHSTAMSIIGEKLGELAGHAAGLSGVAGLGIEAAGAAIPWLGKRLAASGIATRNDLLQAAMLHPDVARVLMTRVPANGAVTPALQRRIAAQIQTALSTEMGRASEGQRRRNAGAPTGRARVGSAPPAGRASMPGPPG